MKNKTISIGHKNPDTDSISSSILISRFGKKIFGVDVEATRAGDINNETKYVLSLLKIKKPRLLKKIKRENVVLVDTTEPKQVIDGFTGDNLLAIIDHHNLGGLKSSKTIYCRIEPVGCTCSVVYKILQEKGIRIDKTSATLIIAAIISDTLNFNSPSATKEDKRILKELNKVANLDIKRFAEDLFVAKSSLKGISISDIVGKDYKQFDMGSSKVGIGVWETTDPESVNLKKGKIIKSLAKKKNDEKMDYVFFAVVDIIKNNSYLYVIGEKESSLARDVFGKEIKDSLMFLEGVVSRKKQVVPQLKSRLEK
jgi:manganese-dependent inorganic pyrophosphatase